MSRRAHAEGPALTWRGALGAGLGWAAVLAAVPLILAAVPNSRADAVSVSTTSVSAAALTSSQVPAATSLAPRPVVQYVPANATVPAAPAPPASVSIPAAQVSATITPLSAASGTLAVPSDISTVGWMQESALPGQVGPSVLVGHVDGKSGPAVFYRLRELQPGAEVAVAAVDGTSVTYRVREVAHYGKDDLPLERIYGQVISPELRLITCGGAFDHTSGHYEDNVVVYASVVQ